MWVLFGLAILYCCMYMILSAYRTRKDRRNMKWGHDVASSMPEDDSVGPVRTMSREGRDFDRNFRVEPDVSPLPQAPATQERVPAPESPEIKRQVWSRYYQFNIVSREQRPFTLERLREVFSSERLTLGKFDIVYYNDPATGKELFRVSSMIKPGTFPRAIAGNDNSYSSSSWSTKGISVIMFLPEKGSAETRFDQIIAHVRRLNTALDGLLCTRELRPLTDDVIEEYRSQMRSYDSQP
jgi:FtsZ-interacting cell division protein ZipA